MSPTVPGRSLPVTKTVCCVVLADTSLVPTSTSALQLGPKKTMPCPGFLLDQVTAKPLVADTGVLLAVPGIRSVIGCTALLQVLARQPRPQLSSIVARSE